MPRPPCEEAEGLPAEDAVADPVPRRVVPHVLQPLHQAAEVINNISNGIVMRNEISVHISTPLQGIIHQKRNDNTEEIYSFHL